eukprot:CAMPEP_0172929494 /NCGR_PEP_ID=MMETSP1075-20121228/218512_1 /TAXON_ID=2916 /ORGANISM="Ceratium fusus, Strain PA161109" /LENGTH=353 /DNA_ID=CAMNT_0013790789 /DNA_START=69 /DNA_END=1127 /DNA_ORIENTATION=+
MTLLQGMFLVTLRAFAKTAAENLQRYAQNLDPPRRSLNLLGVLLGVCTAPLDMVAYSVAAQSVLAPFGMLSLLLNFAVAHVHGDKFRRTDVLATLLVIAGSLICLPYGAPSSKGPVAMPSMRALEVYAACLFTCTVVLGSILAALNKVGGRADAFMHCLLGGILGSSTLVASKLMFAALVSEDRTFGMLSLLLNFAVAHIHGDKFRRTDVLATLLVIAGSLICLPYGAPSSKGPVGMPPMRSLGIYAACLFTCCVVFGSILRCLNKVGGRPDAFMHCLLGGILGSSTLVASKLMFAALVSEDRTIVRVALSAVPLITLAPIHLKVINRGFGRHPLVFMSPGLGTCGMLSNVAT